ncbi:MAG: DUF302 domain-containing protein, partial [Novosphingobium sp.]
RAATHRPFSGSCEGPFRANNSAQARRTLKRSNSMKKLLALAFLSLALSGAAVAEGKAVDTPAFDKTISQQMIDSSIQRFKLADDVSVDDAVESMKLRANGLNFKLVADLPLSEQVKAMGEDSNYMRILAFCDALIAKKMVQYNIIFAGFLPCRIAVVEDDKGQGWIVTMNMDMMLHAVDLPPDLQPLAKKVRDTIYSIVDAGVNGDL